MNDPHRTIIHTTGGKRPAPEENNYHICCNIANFNEILKVYFDTKIGLITIKTTQSFYSYSSKDPEDLEKYRELKKQIKQLYNVSDTLREDYIYKYIKRFVFLNEEDFRFETDFSKQSTNKELIDSIPRNKKNMEKVNKILKNIVKIVNSTDSIYDNPSKPKIEVDSRYPEIITMSYDTSNYDSNSISSITKEKKGYSSFKSTKDNKYIRLEKGVKNLFNIFFKHFSDDFNFDDIKRLEYEKVSERSSFISVLFKDDIEIKIPNNGSLDKRRIDLILNRMSMINMEKTSNDDDKYTTAYAA